MRWGFPETDNGKSQLHAWKNLYIEVYSIALLLVIELLLMISNIHLD